MSNLEIGNNGTKRWRNDKDQFHRLDGPAFESFDGNRTWWINGERHRLDGPAIERVNGDKYWFVNGKSVSGPLELLEYGANWKDLVEWMTPREIAQCRT